MKHRPQRIAFTLCMSLFAIGLFCSVYGGPWWGYLLPFLLCMFPAVFVFLVVDVLWTRLLFGMLGFNFLFVSLSNLANTGFNALWLQESGFGFFCGLAVLLPAFIGNSWIEETEQEQTYEHSKKQSNQ